MGYPSFQKDKNEIRITEREHDILRGQEQTFHARAYTEWHKQDKILEIIEKMIVFCLGAVFLGYPLFFLNLTLQGLAFEKQLYFYFWTLLALILWSLKGIMEGELRIKRTLLDLPILAFIVAYFLAAVFSVDRWHSFLGAFGDPSRGFVNVLLAVIFYYLLASVASFKRLGLFLNLLLFSYSLVVLYGALGVLNWWPAKIIGLVPVSMAGSFSEFMILVSFMIPLLFSVIMKLSGIHGKKILKWIYLSLALLILTFCLLMFSYLNAFLNVVGWIALALGMITFMLYLLSSRIKTNNFKWIWLPMFSCFLLLIIYLVGPLTDNPNVPTEISLNLNSSLEIAKGSLKENFFIGSGPATYGYDFSLFRPQDLNQGDFYNLRFFQGNGMLFEWISTLGSLGIILALILSLSFLSIGYYLLGRVRKESLVLVLGLFSASIIFIVDVFFVTAGGSLLTMGMMLISLTIFFMLEESGVVTKSVSMSVKMSSQYALAIAFIFLIVSASVVLVFVFMGRVLNADILMKEVSSNNIKDRIQMEKNMKAVALYPMEARYHSLLGEQLAYFANAQAINYTKENVEIIKDDLNGSISSSMEAVNLNKNDVGANEILAQVYKNAGLYVPRYLDDSLDQYKRALELEPNNPLYPLEIAEILTQQAYLEKDKDKKNALIVEAKSWIAKSITKKNNLAESYYRSGSVSLMLQQTDEAINDIQKAIMLDNTKAAYFIALGNAYASRGKESDYKVAEQLYESVIKGDKENNEARLSLGLLYEKMNDFTKAAQQYEEILSQFEKEEDKTKLQKMIDNAKNGIANSSENLATE